MKTRADIQQCVRDLFTPLKPCFSEGGARVRVGVTGAIFSPAAEEFEGFSRPLWGLAPLAAGGGGFDDWPLYRRGLDNGSNPAHAEYWGLPPDRDQRLVDMAALGLALLLAPEQVWTPLLPEARTRLAAWLGQINQRAVVNNNWHFFRVLVNLGLASVGAPHDTAGMSASLDWIDELYLGGGWYRDGNPVCDYYNPFAFHFYALLYVAHAAKSDAARASRFKERAAEFAQDFIHMFAADGSAIPYGRSLTYRFAQGAFWGALAYANVEVFDWGVVKGIHLRHLRWWFRQPMFDSSGLLTVGYAYPNQIMAESYNSSSSPYWSMKTFLPLALPESHPFWASDEKPLPVLKKAHVIKHPGFILCSGETRAHVVALANGQNGGLAGGFRHAAEKYSKFAYSTLFAFSVCSDQAALPTGAHDSMLALSEEDRYFRVRRETVETAILDGVLYSRWLPWPDVEVETWLAPAWPWHIRVHRLRTPRRLLAVESGFALDSSADEGPVPGGRREDGAGFSLAVYPSGVCGLRDLAGRRRGEIYNADPNTNLQHPRTLIPSLREEYEPGEHWLLCAVLAVPATGGAEAAWNHPPRLLRQTGPPVLVEAGGEPCAAP